MVALRSFNSSSKRRTSSRRWAFSASNASHHFRALPVVLGQSQCSRTIVERSSISFGVIFCVSQDSMGMHADNEPEMGNVIGSLSLGATRTFRIRHNKTKETKSFQVGNGTLIIMAGTMQRF